MNFFEKITLKRGFFKENILWKKSINVDRCRFLKENLKKFNF